MVLALPALGDTHYLRSRTLNSVTKDSRITCMCIAAVLPAAKRGLDPIHVNNNVLGPFDQIINRRTQHRFAHRLVFPPSLTARSSASCNHSK
jgi:hypothetical protein